MTRLSQWCVSHPVATTLLTLAVAILGVLAFPRLPVAPLPQAEFPTIRVSASLPGASPDTMASAVATPLEVALSAVPGITEMTSSSSQGRVSITLQFSLDKDSGKTVVKVMDTDTNEVIRQIPSEEVLAISKAVDKLKGLLIKQQA